ncbi:MAG: DUF4091 domain-containing protein [Planctomycetota bacterium]|nr:MAG: DUF4091 domain-containing protein [Planctomycetota bacterium]
MPALAAIAILALAAADPAGGQDAAWLVDELEALYPDRDPAPEQVAGPEIRSDTARGTIAGVHLLLRRRTAGEVAVRVEGLPTALAAGLRWYRLVDVPVEENTGLGSRTEQFEGKVNPFVIRRAPFRVFEALAPARPPLAAPAGRSAWRLEVAVPAAAEPGEHLVRLRLGGLPELRWRLVVHQAVVPPPGRNTLQVTNWWSPATIAERHGLEPWSEAHWAMIARYAALMARGRQNTFWIRCGDVFAPAADGAIRFRRDRFERLVGTFRAAGLWWIEGSPLAHRPGGDWSKEWLELNVAGVPATGPEGRAALAAMLGPLRACLEENGWLDAWLQHLADEPTDTNAADYRRLAAVVRELLPGVPIVEATMSRELVGAVDVWCPQVQEYQRHRSFFAERRAAGDRLWTYTCLVPGGPWVNRLLDQERVRQVAIGWGAAKYRLDGFLHWGFNHWQADPFERSVVDHPAQPGTKNKLPAGDTHVVYPGPDGPWSGQRFEAQRIGLEDRELLERLRARDPAACERILGEVFRSYDDTARDVASWRAARRELLAALDRE